MSRRLKFRQKLNPRMAEIERCEYHFWGYIDGGFVSPVGKNQAVGGSEQYVGKDEKGNDVYEKIS